MADQHAEEPLARVPTLVEQEGLARVAAEEGAWVPPGVGRPQH